MDISEKLNGAAAEHRQDMVRFLRDLIVLPGDTGNEGARALRIREEMKRVGFERTEIDDMGNVLGYVGAGETLVAMDGHIDTTGPGNLSNWNCDPREGHEDETYVYGRGASDQLGGIVSAVYAGKLMKEFDMLDGVTLLVTGTVQEEDCDGGCWQYMIRERGIRPEFVLLTEPTDGRVVRGQRGRMDIKVTTRGVSSHGSAPDRGDNAIYRMAPILLDLEQLNLSLTGDSFLGPGSLAVSEIFFSSPSRNSVADLCSISVDRRLTMGESRETALAEIRALAGVKQAGATVEVYEYDHPSYTGHPLRQESYFPTWLMDESEPCVQAVATSFASVFGRQAEVGKWIFSTNGVGIMGTFDIPCVGYGPGKESEAHAPNEKVAKEDLVMAAALYALVPGAYMKVK